MFEKNLRHAYLLDVYGELLTERKKEVLDMYYNEDLSLSEVAEQIGISRQGVRDLIKKAEDELSFFEEKLGLAKKLSELSAHSNSLLDIIEKSNISNEDKTELREIYDLIK